MRIAIIGAGISGLYAAHEIHREHDLTIFEANDYVGGHTNTVDFERDGKLYSIDTGFIVYNNRTYPRFTQLLRELNVPTQQSEMSFGVRCLQDGLEYCGTGINGLFAQRRNLLSPKFWRLIRDWLRFSREAGKVLARGEDTVSVGRFLREGKYSAEFREWYFLPMGSAVWSCPRVLFEEFPIRFIAEFYRNHGLLSIFNRPRWRVIKGGSQSYVRELIRPFASRIRLRMPVVRMERTSSQVRIGTADGMWTSFEAVVFACHSDQALKILGEHATNVEREILGAFPYQKNVATLHTDEGVMPRRRRAWASWNYRMDGNASQATVTYWMNRLQSIDSPPNFFVTLNGEDLIDPAKVLRQFNYEHPTFSASRAFAQSRHVELLGANRTYYCGAYWRNGFHEDGIESAWRVARLLQSRGRLLHSGVSRPDSPVDTDVEGAIVR
jgi:predicted NAD/FAD-binding protein